MEALNDQYINERHLTGLEIAEIYNRSRCGLILSLMEGACFTVFEDLLSGLPVVSTRPESPLGLGGREMFLDEEITAWCDPDPASVKAAVDELCRAIWSAPMCAPGRCARSTYTATG